MGLWMIMLCRAHEMRSSLKINDERDEMLVRRLLLAVGYLC